VPSHAVAARISANSSSDHSIGCCMSAPDSMDAEAHPLWG
jgi:hypothetical protein